MKAEKKFLNQPKHFWATVKALSQKIGYSNRGRGDIKVPSLQEITKAFKTLNLNPEHLVNEHFEPTKLSQTLLDYFSYRADILNNYVEPRLMDAERAEQEYNKLLKTITPTSPQPMNKQKGDKRANAYLTCIINMLVENNIGDYKCDYDPRELTTVTYDGAPLRTLSRRVDGAFPSPINPIAIWEIKEYYYTTTFGSRVADGVYETLLDGMEVEELYEHEGINIHHYLMVDSHFTWWKCGRSYLCRIVDMLHMGYVDEVLFGYEVIERLPEIVKEWVAELEAT